MTQSSQAAETIHILGICGTFMGGLAMIARELGYQVCGTDANVYPPMSTQLEQSGIRLFEGYKAEHLDPAPDRVIVGNAMSRGNPMVEYLLNRGIPYTSGPQWLAENVLQNRWVLAVAGTHGKTTTTSMLAWILEDAGLDPGFLIGGVAENFGISARLGNQPFFVIEADEYDTAFFDKRSKFVHYRPRTSILNNLEFDHADIFDDLEAIKRQFHHLVRTVPGSGLIVYPAADTHLQEVLDRGCWTPVQTVGISPDNSDWRVQALTPDFGKFSVSIAGGQHRVDWPLIGEHNAFNAVAAMAAARHVGVTPEIASQALSRFRSVRRRLECLGVIKHVSIYDDFAHHPTAIATTLNALRQHVGPSDKARIISILEPRSNTMRMGVHKDRLAESLSASDLSLIYAPPDLGWDIQSSLVSLGDKCRIFSDIGSIISCVVETARSGDHVLIMSNGGFAGIHGKLMNALQNT